MSVSDHIWTHTLHRETPTPYKLNVTERRGLRDMVVQDHLARIG